RPELGGGGGPALEQRRAERRARVADVPLEEPAQLVAADDARECDQISVQPQRQLARRVVDEGLAAAHPGADVAAELAQHDAGGQKRAEALAGGSLEARPNAARRLPGTERAADQPAEPRPDGTVPGADRVRGLDERGVLECRSRLVRQPLAQLPTAGDGHRL